jgi:hypothetical protein
MLTAGPSATKPGGHDDRRRSRCVTAVRRARWWLAPARTAAPAQVGRGRRSPTTTWPPGVERAAGAAGAAQLGARRGAVAAAGAQPRAVPASA